MKNIVEFQCGGNYLEQFDYSVQFEYSLRGKAFFADMQVPEQEDELKQELSMFFKYLIERKGWDLNPLSGGTQCNAVRLGVLNSHFKRFGELQGFEINYYRSKLIAELGANGEMAAIDGPETIFDDSKTEKE